MFRSSPLKYRHFSVFMFLAFSKNARKRKKKKLRLDSVSARLIVSHSIKELRKVIFGIFCLSSFSISTKGANGSFYTKMVRYQGAN